MTKKKPTKKKTKKFVAANGNITLAKAKYDNQLVGSSPNSMSIGC